MANASKWSLFRVIWRTFRIRSRWAYNSTSLRCHELDEFCCCECMSPVIQIAKLASLRECAQGWWQVTGESSIHNGLQDSAIIRKDSTATLQFCFCINFRMPRDNRYCQSLHTLSDLSYQSHNCLGKGSLWYFLRSFLCAFKKPFILLPPLY